MESGYYLNCEGAGHGVRFQETRVRRAVVHGVRVVPLPAALVVRRPLLAQQLLLPVDLLAFRRDLLLSPGQFLERVSISPILLKGGADALRHELPEPEPVLHALLSRLLLLYRALLLEQLLDHLDALVDVLLVLVDGFLLRRDLMSQIVLLSRQLLDLVVPHLEVGRGLRLELRYPVTRQFSLKIKSNH